MRDRLCRRPQFLPDPPVEIAVHFRHEPHDFKACLLQHTSRSGIRRVCEGSDLRQLQWSAVLMQVAIISDAYPLPQADGWKK